MKKSSKKYSFIVRICVKIFEIVKWIWQWQWNLRVFCCHGCERATSNEERFRLRHYVVAYFHKISFCMSFATDTSYFRVVSFENIRREKYPIDPHPRTSQELSPVRHKCTSSRYLSARALFHCVSDPEVRIGCFSSNSAAFTHPLLYLLCVTT